MKKKGRSRLVLFVASLLFLCGVLIWYFQKELVRLAGFDRNKAAPQEKISNEDRKQLEEILKRR